MKYDKEVRAEIISIVEQRRILKERMDDLIQILIASCDHASVIETPYYTTVFDSYTPARRICIQCGLEEDSWFRVLNATPVRIVHNRNDFWKLRTLGLLTEVAVPA